MMRGSSRVREEFSIADGRLVRKLSIGDSSGESAMAADAGEFDDLASGTVEDLQSAWDRGRMVGASVSQESVPTAEIRVADVFCGAGGLSYGVCEAITAAGMAARVVMGADTDPIALDVYRRNFDPARHSTQSVWTSVTKNYSTRRGAAFRSVPRLLTDEFRDCAGRVDILLGGPPCEGHSTANNHTLRSDARNVYYVAMPALAVALEAGCVVVENVPGIQHDHRQVLNEAKGLFESSGYFIDDGIVDAVKLGLPQTRKRHILIASKYAQPDLSAAVESLARPERDLRWAIGDLVDVEPASPLDKSADLSEVNRQRIGYLFDNDEYNLPNAWRPDSHKGGHTYPSIYGRLSWDKPSGTITTGFNSPGRGRYIHPERRRTITPHEAARIQGFPDRFEFNRIDGNFPTRTSIAKMIGDAAPPQMGYAAGAAALATMDLEAIARR